MIAPAQLLLTLLLGLVAIGVLAIALWLLTRLNRPAVRTVVRSPETGRAAGTAVNAVKVLPDPTERRRKVVVLAVALALILAVVAGRFAVQMFYPRGQEPVALSSGTASKVHGSSGAELTVVQLGPVDAPTLLFTHGWGADKQDWAYVIGALPSRFHVVVWDLPGLGESSSTGQEPYSMQTMASDLDSVVSSLHSGPLILVGHSIGGMLNLEYARKYPEKLGKEVAAIVQANTTFTNPLATKKDASTSLKLQKPLYEPLLHAVIWTSPLARVASWFAYQSGLVHLQLASQSFAGTETWEQLDMMAKYAYRSSPGVIAKGILAMGNWDATEVLPKVSVPTLVISGNQDVTTLPAASDRMVHDLPKAERVSVERAAHFGPVEQYKAYADAIGSFATRSTNGSAKP